MGLLDEIRAENTPVAVCPIGVALADLNDDDAAELVLALGDESIQHRSITRVLAARGYKIAADGKAVARHRKGECSCRA